MQYIIQYQALAFVAGVTGPPTLVAVSSFDAHGPSQPYKHTYQDLSRGYIGWDVGELVAPPIPPEPPIPPPEVRRTKPMVIRVQHLRRPVGGFNTIYYVDDPEDGNR